MNIDKQISDCEERIALLEEHRRQKGDVKNTQDRVLDDAYEQIALLKIRKMMDY